MIYKDFIIKENKYFNNKGIMYDISYTIYFKSDKTFFTNYFNKTIKQVKHDLDNYI